MEILTVKKKIKKGDYTYSLMGNYVLHINNDKTNRSITVPVQPILELTRESK